MHSSNFVETEDYLQKFHDFVSFRSFIYGLLLHRSSKVGQVFLSLQQILKNFQLYLNSILAVDKLLTLIKTFLSPLCPLCPWTCTCVTVLPVFCVYLPFVFVFYIVFVFLIVFV